MPDSLKELLADERVLKCGVSIAHDAELLLAQYSLPVRGFVDLAAVSHRTGHTNSGLGLQPIVRAVLGADLSKEVAVQCSDWSADLTEEQIYYAASDAHSAQRALFKLHEIALLNLDSPVVGDTRLAPASSPDLMGWCEATGVIGAEIGPAERQAMRAEATKKAGAERASAQSPSKARSWKDAALSAAGADKPSPPTSAVRSPKSSDSSSPRGASAKSPKAAAAAKKKPAQAKAKPVQPEAPVVAKAEPKKLAGAWGKPDVARQLFN